MKILHIISSLNPEYGGPVTMVISQSKEMLRQGHEVDIVITDVDDRRNHVVLPGVNIHALGPSMGNFGITNQLIPWMKAHASEFDLILVHGIWQYCALGTWIASRQAKFDYFIYTHGALDPWFKRTYPIKHLKKWLYWPWATYRILRDARGVLFTCEEERRLARQSFWLYKANEIIEYIGIETPNDQPESSKEIFLQKFPKLQGKRILLFLSRIQTKKGCDILIDAFSRVSADDPDLHLVMAGPDQEGWMATLKEQALALGIEERITWTGMLEGDLKWGAYRSADVFVLPSHSENFGMVVAEALACRLPVLTTNKVNIWREVQDDDAGLISNDDLKGFTTILKQWLSMSEEEKNQMRDKAKACFQKRFEISRTVASLIKKLKSV